MADAPNVTPSDLDLQDSIAASRPLADANNNRVMNDDDPEEPQSMTPLATGNTTMPTLGGGSAPVSPAQPAQPAAPAAAPTTQQKVGTIAHGIMTALGGSNGAPGSWAKAILAGGIAGMSAAAQAPVHPGGGWAAGLGIGAGAAINDQKQQAQQAQDNKLKQNQQQMEQQRLELEKSKTLAEQGNESERLKLAQAEDARRQAESLRDGVLFEKNVSKLDLDIKNGNFESTKQVADYVDQQANKWNALQHIGAKPLEVNGAKAQEFDHLGDAEQFAMANKKSVIGNHALQLVRDPESGKYAIYEVPNEAPSMRDLTDASGKKVSMLLTPAEYLDKQKEIAETKHYLNVASKSSLELKEELEAYKEGGTVKGARKELTSVGGDYSKLTPGSREALLRDVNDRFSKAQAGLEKELQKPEELRDKDTVSALTTMRDEYAKQSQALWNNHPNNVGGGSGAGDGAAKPDQKTPQFTPKQAPAGMQPPKPGYVFGSGAQGDGWYKAPAQAAAPPAAAPAAAAPAAAAVETQPAL